MENKEANGPDLEYIAGMAEQVLDLLKYDLDYYDWTAVLYDCLRSGGVELFVNWLEPKISEITKCVTGISMEAKR